VYRGISCENGTGLPSGGGLAKFSRLQRYREDVPVVFVLLVGHDNEAPSLTTTHTKRKSQTQSSPKLLGAQKLFQLLALMGVAEPFAIIQIDPIHKNESKENSLTLLLLELLYAV
jgi:hypothetical protein